jgi:hypothetical protein
LGEDERKKQLAAIQAAVGKGGDQLTITQDKDSGKYLVGINGDAAAFSKISDATAAFAKIIQDPEVAKFAFAASADKLAVIDKATGQPYTLGGSKLKNGLAGRDPSGQLWAYVLRPSECCESQSGASFGRFTMGGLLDFFGITTVSETLGTVSAHEFGHGKYFMQIGPNGKSDSATSNRSALDLENASRKAKDPNAPVRTVH